MVGLNENGLMELVRDVRSTERPEAMDKGAFTIGSITSEAVCQAVELAVAMHKMGMTLAMYRHILMTMYPQR